MATQLYAIRITDMAKYKQNNLSDRKLIDGLLADGFDETKPMLYTQIGVAKQKASIFGGKIEKVGKEYQTDEAKIIKLLAHEISSDLKAKLAGSQYFNDIEPTSQEHIYNSGVFENLLDVHKTIEAGRVKAANVNIGNDVVAPFLSESLVDECRVLSEICTGYDYLQLIKSPTFLK